MQVGGACRDRPAERDSGGEMVGGDVLIGGPLRDVIVPAPADGVVEQNALEAMIGADRPFARGGERGERLSGELEPADFEGGAVHPGEAFGVLHRSEWSEVSGRGTLSKWFGCSYFDSV